MMLFWGYALGFVAICSSSQNTLTLGFEMHCPASLLPAPDIMTQFTAVAWEYKSICTPLAILCLYIPTFKKHDDKKDS